MVWRAFLGKRSVARRRKLRSGDAAVVKRFAITAADRDRAPRSLAAHVLLCGPIDRWRSQGTLRDRGASDRGWRWNDGSNLRRGDGAWAGSDVAARWSSDRVWRGAHLPRAHQRHSMMFRLRGRPHGRQRSALGGQARRTSAAACCSSSRRSVRIARRCGYRRSGRN